MTANFIVRKFVVISEALTELRLKGDSEIVMKAVSHDGLALKHAAEVLRADQGVVMQAVSQHGAALQFAAEELRRNREIVMTAVSKHGSPLQFVAERTAVAAIQLRIRIRILEQDQKGYPQKEYP